mgnify:CR=1 FL=1
MRCLESRLIIKMSGSCNERTFECNHSTLGHGDGFAKQRQNHADPCLQLGVRVDASTFVLRHSIIDAGNSVRGPRPRLVCHMSPISYASLDHSNRVKTRMVHTHRSDRICLVGGAIGIAAVQRFRPCVLACRCLRCGARMLTVRYLEHQTNRGKFVVQKRSR